jgi:hypothetical protein
MASERLGRYRAKRAGEEAIHKSVSLAELAEYN